MFNGKNILITGGTGSFGKRLKELQKIYKNISKTYKNTHYEKKSKLPYKSD